MPIFHMIGVLAGVGYGVEYWAHHKFGGSH